MKRLSSLLFILLAGTVLFLCLKFLPREGSVKKILSSQLTVIDLPKVKVIYRTLLSPEDILPVKCGSVLPVTYTKVVSLAGLPPEERKKRFIDLVLPSVLIVNYEVKAIRENLVRVLEKLRKRYKLSREEVRFVESILRRCRSDTIEDAILKAHPVPPSLVIAQAALESGWGTSRFFVEGNNLFGVWAFRKDDNVIEAEGSNALLRRYGSILNSVRDYIFNVNVGWAYSKFREGRLKGYDPLKLSEFLSLYSVERRHYVEKVKRIIKRNNLRRFDLCVLDPSYIY